MVYLKVQSRRLLERPKKITKILTQDSRSGFISEIQQSYVWRHVKSHGKPNFSLDMQLYRLQHGITFSNYVYAPLARLSV